MWLIKRSFVPRPDNSCLKVLTAVIAFTAMAAAHEPITTKVTFNKEIVRILRQRCLDCHREGGVSFRLDTYAEARPWAKAIKEEVLEGRMPPWHAAKGAGSFHNDRSLTILEKDLLVDWVEGGAPKGEDKDLPPVAEPASHGLGEPGLVVPGPAVKGNRWVRAWEFRPNNAAALEEVEFWIVSAGQRSYLGNWVAPESVVVLPENVGVFLAAGSRIELRPHYKPDQAADREPGKLALYFAEKPPTRRLRVMPLSCGPNRLPQGVAALAIRPKQSLEILAIRPNRTIEPLGIFSGVPAASAATYWFQAPVDLPLGSSLQISSPEQRCSGYLAYTTR